MPIRVIFNWGLQDSQDCFDVTLLCFVIGQIQHRKRLRPCHSHFPALKAVSLFSLWILIGWWRCQSLFWLVVVVHSIENCYSSKILLQLIYIYRKKTTSQYGFLKTFIVFRGWGEDCCKLWNRSFASLQGAVCIFVVFISFKEILSLLNMWTNCSATDNN